MQDKCIRAPTQNKKLCISSLQFLLFLEVKQPSGFQQDPQLQGDPRTLVRVWILSSWAKTTPSTNTRTSGAEKCVSVCLLCDFYASLSVWETSKPKLSAFSLWQVSLSKRLNAFPIHEKTVADSFLLMAKPTFKIFTEKEGFSEDDPSKLKHHMMISCISYQYLMQLSFVPNVKDWKRKNF